eukprot:m51a1_g13271 hypothetical protein (491) ;mRNA; r:392-2534
MRPTAGTRHAAAGYATLRGLVEDRTRSPPAPGAEGAEGPGEGGTLSSPPPTSALQRIGGMLRSFGTKTPEPEIFVVKGPLPQDVIRGDAMKLVEAIRDMDRYKCDHPAFVDHWTSRPPPIEQWADKYAVPESSLVDPAAQSDGYHIEASRSAVTFTYKDSDMPCVLYAEDDYPYFKEFIMPHQHEHYLCSEGQLAPVVVSVDLFNDMGIAKAIIRTKKETRRVVLPPIKGLRSFSGALPGQFKDMKFVKAKNCMELSAQLVTYDEKSRFKKYKFGVIFCGPDQHDENDIFGNISGSPEYEEFLGLMGEKIELRGWQKYRGGLDVKDDNTGTHSHYTTYGQYEIMFHVATLLPYQPDDLQKVERKRHIGNDVCVIVFRDAPAAAAEDRFHPKILTSHFNHSFFVVSPVKDAGGAVTHYALTIANKPAVPPYPPFFHSGQNAGVFPKGPEFREFLLVKMMNAERSALAGSPEFTSLLTTRKQQLATMCKQHS